MTLAMTNIQDGGRRKKRGGRSQRSRTQNKGGRNQRSRNQNKGGRNQRSRSQNRGGTSVTVPTGLFLLNQYLKARKSRKANNKSSKKTRTFKRK
jgi:hypothetical protein